MSSVRSGGLAVAERQWSPPPSHTHPRMPAPRPLRAGSPSTVMLKLSRSAAACCATFLASRPALAGGRNRSQKLLFRQAGSLKPAGRKGDGLAESSG